ncbi:MAG TPA: hypothetical protein VN108_01700 [Marmoricola sp.]|nr:hypothetical protein [Marmoricola sp.]
MSREREPIEELSAAIAEQAHADGLAIKISRARRDGYGLVDAPVIQVETGGSTDPILIWHEQGNDFWIEFGNGIPDAAWWSKGHDLGVLAKVVAQAVAGELQVVDGRVIALVNGIGPVRLAERL